MKMPLNKKILLLAVILISLLSFPSVYALTYFETASFQNVTNVINGASSNKGVEFWTNYTNSSIITLINFTKHPLDGATNWAIINYNTSAQVANGTWSGNVANINYTLAKYTRYVIYANYTGSANWYYSQPFSSAVITNYLNFTRDYENGAFGNSNKFQFVNFTLQINEPVILSNATITANAYFTSSAITNLSATATNASGFIYNGSTTNGTINGWSLLVNSSSLWNLSIISNESGGYYTTNYTNVNVSTAFVAQLSQVYAYFNASELMTLNPLSAGTFFVSQGASSTTITANALVNLTAGDYNITYSQSAFYNKTQSFTFTALTGGTNTLAGVYNATINISLRNNLTNAIITGFQVDLTNNTYSYTDSETTLTNVLRNNITAGGYLVDISSAGFFSAAQFYTNYSYNTTNITYYLMPIGGLNVIFIRTDTGAVINTTNSTIIFQNSTRSLNFSIISGVGNITGLAGDTYTVLCQTPGFSNNTFAFTYSAVSPPNLFVCYMTQSTSQITFQVQSPDLTPLQGALVTVSQFVNGTLQNVTQEYTDATGQTVMSLLQGVTTTITISLEGYLTQTTTNSLDLSTYTFTLNPVSRFNPNNNAGSNIIYSFYPAQIDLNLSIWNFALNVTPTNTTLNFFQIEIYSQNGTFISRTNSTNATGGNLILPLNVTPYNGTFLRVYYSFQKTNFTTYTAVVIYNVRDTFYTGSITQVRDYAIANFTLGERIFLWMFLTIVSAVLLYMFGFRDLLNVLPTSLIWYALAWVFGMNMIIVGFILFILILAILRYTL